MCAPLTRPTVWVDADGCPVVDSTIAVARRCGCRCVLVCDTAHEFAREGAETLTVSQGADSADLCIVQRVRCGDVVVTQDYGLAALCLARRARPIRQDGLPYTDDNIEALLSERYTSAKARRAGARLKGPKKRDPRQNRVFEEALLRLLAE